MSTLEDHLHPKESNHDHHDDHQEQESSFPVLYFEFDICLSSSEDDDDTHHDDDAHDHSLRPRKQQYRNPNLQKLQQSDQACCGISLNEEGAEFSIHHSDEESSFLEQEEDDKDDSGSYSSSSYSLSSHDEQRRRRHPSLWRQARKNMIAAMHTKEYQRGPRPEDLQQEEDRRKVRRMKACSGIDSVDLASCPRVNRHRRRRRTRSSSSVLGPTATSVARFLATNKRTSKIVPIPSENDSLVISKNRMSKQRQQEDSIMIPRTPQEP